MLLSLKWGLSLAFLVALPAAGQTINEDNKLVASDAEADDQFGSSVDIFGNTVIIGSPFDDDIVFNSSGSAYIFDITSGDQLFKLTASDGGAGGFGISVGMSDTTAIVGAFYDDTPDFSSGSAYLFDTATGQQLFKLIADNPVENGWFGFSVAISGTTALVGELGNSDAGSSSGSAYLFDTSTGQQLFKLAAADAAAYDLFGISVAISGTIAIIGAPNDDDAGFESGSAYLFDTTTGQQLFKLTASDAEPGDAFGNFVSISGTTAIVGAIGDSDSGSTSGSAYLFDTTTGQQLFKLTASDAAENDWFGVSVSIAGTTAIVGAQKNDDTADNSGSAYLFDTTTGEQILKLTASDAATDDFFGAAVTLSESTVIIGAFKDDDIGIDSGSAYIFNIGSMCRADLTGEGMLNFFDISLFIEAFIAHDPGVDFTGDGQFDLFDVNAFLNAFNAGCP